ncbi:MAG TPA: AraC family transcriptional regulator [Candidatus Sphingobacterium stercoripullorum]|uniref:AraC family transcriptional regulator n=1 Tax=Candidatus Sphingobacterium stercoripullorum TaxID=2838759 RepID=A0A9D2AZC8_9SPHI|nr:AraC family transcriptional regulator [Candidatus Sphingobacterium stercoripullorum]
MQTGTQTHNYPSFYQHPVKEEDSCTTIFRRFEHLLEDYFNSENPQLIGLPSVAYFAYSLHLSPNYFGDLIKRMSGETPRNFIHNKIVKLSKHKIHFTDQSISEIAYQLGFTYPQHFMRLFKKKVGYTPTEYRLKTKQNSTN